MKKSIVLSLITILLTSCVTNVNPPVITPVSPKPSATPSAQVSATPIPSLSPTPSAIPEIQLKREAISGFSDVYADITAGEYGNLHDDIKDESELILKANPKSIIVDLRQESVDSDLNGEISDEEDNNWDLYDDIFDLLQNSQKNVRVVFKIHPQSFPGTGDVLSVTEHLSFINQVAKRYQKKNISWIFEEQINDKNSLLIAKTEFVDVFKRTAQVIKAVNKEQKVYLGSLSPSEIFAKPLYFSVDNFLSFINLGVADYSDGFIFEVYALSPSAADDSRNSTRFAFKDYQLLGSYYNLINEALNQRKIKGKELILFTSTYGDANIGNTFQSEAEQARFFFVSAIYAFHKGFNQVYAAKFYDDTILDTGDFFAKSGVLKRVDKKPVYKSAFWSVAFVSYLLNDSVYTGEIPDLPAGIRGYIFEKANSKVYILWNDLVKNDNSVRLKLDQPTLTEYIFPLEADDFIDKIEHTLASDKTHVLAFKNDPLKPIILEVKK